MTKERPYYFWDRRRHEVVEISLLPEALDAIKTTDLGGRRVQYILNGRGVVSQEQVTVNSRTLDPNPLNPLEVIARSDCVLGAEPRNEAEREFCNPGTWLYVFWDRIMRRCYWLAVSQRTAVSIPLEPGWAYRVFDIAAKRITCVHGARLEGPFESRDIVTRWLA